MPVNTPASKPIRIVPLHVPDKPVPESLVGAAPHLTYRGGPLLSAVEVFIVFWGKQWVAAPLAGMAPNLTAFFQYILTSPLIDQLAEYNVLGVSIGHGSLIGSAIVTAPALKSTVSDNAIQSMLKLKLASGEVPPTNANRLYFVYLPPGVTVSDGHDRSCKSFCGYHSDIGGQTFYAVMPYPNCNGCLAGLNALDALTGTSSHELCEAITDPVAGSGWYDDVNGEIGDICAWTFKKLGGYNIQLEWSNQAGRCI